MRKTERHSIPVYHSRFTPVDNMPTRYGAFYPWEIGDRVTILSRRGRRPLHGVIQSGTRLHEDAPEIDGARGRGRYVREVLLDGETTSCAISEAQIVREGE